MKLATKFRTTRTKQVMKATKDMALAIFENMDRTKRAGIGIGVAVLVLTVAGAAWSRTRPVSDPVPHQANGAEVKALVALVAKHIVVKEDEDPTIATVEDPDALRTQNAIFYQDAKKGDRLYIWTDKAVLYSPETDRILSVFPINYPAPPAPPAVNGSSIEVLNGSGIPGLGKTMGANLKKMGMNETVTGNAKGPAYGHTIIVKGANPVSQETLDLLTSLTRGTVGDLPVGEDAPKGDILVIVGADYKP